MSKLERLKEIPSSKVPYSIEKIPSWQGGMTSHPIIEIIILVILIVSVFVLGAYFAWEYRKTLEEQQNNYYQMLQTKGIEE